MEKVNGDFDLLLNELTPKGTFQVYQVGQAKVTNPSKKILDPDGEPEHHQMQSSLHCPIINISRKFD